MNNKSRFIGLSTLAFAAIAAIGCNQQKETYHVSFEGTGCKANCKEAGASEKSTFEFDGKTGSDVTIAINPEATNLLSSAISFKIDGVEAKATEDYTYQSLDGGVGKQLQFKIKGDTVIKVTADKVTGLKIKDNGMIGFTFTTDKEEYDAGDVAEVTMEPTAGYNIPDGGFADVAEAIELAIKGASSASTYSPKDGEVTDEQITFKVDMPRENLLIFAKAKADVYKLCDDSYGCKASVVEPNEVIIADEIEYNSTVKIELAPNNGYEVPLTGDGVEIIADDISYPVNNYKVKDGKATFDFKVPLVTGEDKTVHIKATAKSFPIDIVTTDLRGCTINLPAGPFARNQTINAHVDFKNGYKSEGSVVEVYYYNNGQKVTIADENDYDPINQVLTFTIPDPADITKFDILISFTAAYVQYDIYAFVAEDDHITANIDAEDPAYHIGDAITVNLLSDEGYKLPLNKGDFAFTGIDVAYISYTPGAVDPDTQQQTGKLEFTMPANDITITGTGVAIDYTVTTSIVAMVDGVETPMGVPQIRGIPQIGQPISIILEPKPGYALPEPVDTGLPEGITLTGIEEGDVEYEYVAHDYAFVNFDMPAGNVDVKVFVTIIDYNVRFDIKGAACRVDVVNDSGEVIKSDVSEANVGDHMVLTATVDDNRVTPLLVSDLLKKLTCSGVFLKESNVTITQPTTEPAAQGTIVIKFDMPANGVSINGELEQKIYTVTAAASTSSTHGKVTINGSTFHAGEVVSGTIIPDEHYTYPKTSSPFTFTNTDTGDAVTVTVHYNAGESSFWFVMPATNVTVAVTCQLTTCLITSTSINEQHPASAECVYGGNVSYTFTTPSAGYHIAKDLPEFMSTHTVIGTFGDINYSYDGEGTGTVTLTNVQSNIIITGSAPADTYTISTDVDGGYIEGLPSSAIPAGTPVSLKLVAAPGYTLPAASGVTGTYVPAGGSATAIPGFSYNATTGVITFNMPAGPATIAGDCVEVTKYTVSTNVTGGYVEGVPSSAIPAGTPVSLKIVPMSDYTLPAADADVTVTGTVAPTDKHYYPTTGIVTFTMPAGNVTVNATCVEVTKYTVSTDVTGGYVEGVPSSAIPAGTPVSLKLVAAPGYTLPAAGGVTGTYVPAGGSATAIPGFSYNATTGVITFNMPAGPATIAGECVAP